MNRRMRARMSGGVRGGGATPPPTRFQNLRRVLGYDAQYFGSVEPHDGWPRTCTWPSAARYPGRWSAR